MNELKNFNPHGNFLFTYEEYTTNLRSKQCLRVRCLHCGREYLIAPNELERKYKDWRRRCEERGAEQPFTAFRFCSQQCAHDASPKHQTVEMVCAHCGKHFTRRKDVAGMSTKSGEVFCSKACHAAWRKANNVAKGDKFVADVTTNPNGNFLFTQEEYEATLFPQSRYKKLLPIRCLTCGQTFMASAKQVNNLFTSTGKDRLTLKYCSTACRDKGTQDRVTVKCSNCGKELERQRYELDIKDLFFCDRDCMQEYYKHNPNLKATGPRSKLEKFIGYVFADLFPHLVVDYNNRIVFNGLELDQYYPDLNVGVEINGGWHFIERLTDENRFKTIQEHDAEKLRLSEELDIPLLVIPVEEAWEYTPNRMSKVIPTIVETFVKFVNENTGTTLTVPENVGYRIVRVLYQHRDEICTPSALRWIKWEKYIKPEDLEDPNNKIEHPQ